MPESLFLCSKAFLLLPLTFFLSASRFGADPIDKLTSSLTRWTTTSPQEKLYIHTDKPYYAVGDTIWFKAYVTIGSRHQLSAVSGAMYVDLINGKDSIEKSIKLPVTTGMAMGDFVLTDSLQEGNYRLRAYTQWMRNAGEDYFFDRTFAVGNAIDNEVIGKVSYQYKPGTVKAILNYTDEEGKALAGKEVRYEIKAADKVIGHERLKTDENGNISINLINDQKSNLKGAHIFTVIEPDGKKKVSKVFPIKAALSQSDVQFFPESGNLIAGIQSKVGFKAVAIDGTGTEVKGTITDNEGKEVANFQSIHAGMGSFNLKPEAGKNYKAKITYEDGSETTKELQQIQNSGYVLAVYPNANPDSILIRINAAEKQVQAQETINLIAHTGGEQVFSSPIQIKAPISSIWLIKKDFPTGIAQFTLFNQAGEPINERIAFIRNQDQMQVKLATAKQTYKAKEKVEIEVEAKDQTGKPTLGNFSVSVIDESKVPNNETNESTILSNILLTSDLKGYIEKPNYYFDNPTEQTDKHLDNLMLTQGYRRFVWKDILKETQPEPVYKAEKLMTEISGKIVVVGLNKPVQNGKVILMSLKAGIMKDTTADAQGRFKFDKLLLTDSTEFTVQGRTGKGGKNIEIKLDRVPAQGLTLNPNLGAINMNIAANLKEFLESEKPRLEQQRKFNLNANNLLNTVKIKTTRPMHSFKIPEGMGDKYIKLNLSEECVPLWRCLDSIRIVSFRFEGGYHRPYQIMKELKVFIDGTPADPGIFDDTFLNPKDIASIDVIYNKGGLYMVLGGPTMEIHLRPGAYRRPRYNPTIALYRPQGFTKAREFYSPRYDKPQNSNLLDLRSTVYWNPAVKTSPEGKTKFDFFNADDKGTYKVVIEGINAAGELGRQVYRYNVE